MGALVGATDSALAAHTARVEQTVAEGGRVLAARAAVAAGVLVQRVVGRGDVEGDLSESGGLRFYSAGREDRQRSQICEGQG